MRYFLGTLWLVLLGYALLLSPLNSNELGLIKSLVNLDSGEVEPLVFCLFNLMGLWPIVFAPLMLSDNDYSTSPWAFWILSFGFGVFAILPYYIFRKRGHKTRTLNPGFLKLLNSKYFGLVLAMITVGIIGFGIKLGNLEAFKTYFSNYRFVNVMTLDFFAIQLLFQFAMVEDRWNRGDRRLSPAIISIAVPILGPCIYLMLRLKEDSNRLF